MPSSTHATPGSRKQARRLRSDLTEAEKLLWSKLRRNQLADHHFRRQVPVDRFIADFCCPKAMLIVEVDGGQHAGSTHDKDRTAWLESQGYQVIRFWNNEVLANIEGVLETILRSLPAPPPSPPSP